ncbi:MAG: ATP-binding domain-containing protein, partial [Bacteroidetes bacterium]|nr:ATP-binding domain-containing protein [Bacteroidota bacterium]
YDRTPESLSKYENLQELLNGIREFAEDEKKHNPETEIHMEQYLENIALLTDQDTKAQDDKPKVSLMTIHASKGLEFPYVHIAGMEEELFPSQFSASSGKELQEERRLFYVALTRAMETVIISYAQTRYRWGSLVNCRRSRFIQEINSRFVDLPETSIIQKKPSRQDNRSNWKPSRNLVRIQEAKPNETNTPDFKPDSPDQMQAGMTVLYARFGEGKILKIEGDNPNRKATVFFKSSGQKQLLLKFAKLKILKQQ